MFILIFSVVFIIKYLSSISGYMGHSWGTGRVSILFTTVYTVHSTASGTLHFKYDGKGKREWGHTSHLNWWEARQLDKRKRAVKGSRVDGVLRRVAITKHHKRLGSFKQ